MKTYEFADKNSSCVLVLSAETDDEAIKELEDKVKYPKGWRMEIVDENENHKSL